MPAGFNYGTLSFGEQNPLSFDEGTQKYPADIPGLNIAVIGYGGNIDVGGASVAEGRWTNIDESNIHNLFLQGYFPLESITRVRRNSEGENSELGGKDSRGKFKPDLTETTEQLKSLGVEFYDIPELNINDYIIKREGMAHDFDPELWERLLSPDLERAFDIILVDVGTLDRIDGIDRYGRSITHDAHFKWGDAAVQFWEQQERESDDPNRVLGIETPLAVSYGAAKYLVETSREQGVALVCKGLVEYVHPARNKTLQVLKERGVVPLSAEYHRTDRIPDGTGTTTERAFQYYNSTTKGSPEDEKLVHDAANLIKMCEVLYGVAPDEIIFDEIKMRDLVPGGSVFGFTARPYITADSKSTQTFDSVNAEFTVVAGDRLLRVKEFEGGFISGEKRDSLVTCHTGPGEKHHVFKENTLSTGQIALEPQKKIALGMPTEKDVPMHAVRDITDEKIISCSLEGDAFDAYTPIEHILAHISARSLGFTDKELIPNDMVLKSLGLLDQISIAAQGSGAYMIKNHVAIPVSEFTRSNMI